MEQQKLFDPLRSYLDLAVFRAATVDFRYDIELEAAFRMSWLLR